jgi:hypothetical protein
MTASATTAATTNFKIFMQRLLSCLLATMPLAGGPC